MAAKPTTERTETRHAKEIRRNGLDPYGGVAILPAHGCRFRLTLSVMGRIVQPDGLFPFPPACGESAVLQFSFCRPEPRRPRHDALTPGAAHRLREHGSYLCLATAALAAVALLGLAGCQTPPQTAAPAFGSTVPPPGTGMIGQPATYGAATPQGVAYPPAINAPPMPGPATAWQGVPPAAAPANNTWSWAQSGNAAAPPAGQPPATMQQYGSQLANQANQYQQGATNQTQQYANQLQNQPQQWANQQQQALANQQQQVTNQLQNTSNQYQQGLNNQTQQYANQLQQNTQAAQQQVNAQLQGATNQMQQAVPQMPAGPQQQTANGNWWPFTNASGMPPARSDPAQTTRY